MQRSRRTNPYPFTWEIPVAIGLAVLLLLLIGVQAGRSVANLIAGNGWVLIDRANLFASLPGILTSHAGAGLPAVSRPAGRELLWPCIGVVELLVLVGCTLGVKSGLDRWGPARLQGVATRSQAEAVLGRTRLGKHAKLIRPDLYGHSKEATR